MRKCLGLISTPPADGAGLIDVYDSMLSAAPDFHVNVLRGHFATFEFSGIEVFGKTKNPALYETLLLPFTGNDGFGPSSALKMIVALFYIGT